MDDKEKEKFGVVIDKNNQSEVEKPQVDNESSGTPDANEKTEDQKQNLTPEQPKVDNERQKDAKVETQSTNLSSAEKNSPESNDEVAQDTNVNEDIEKNNEQEKKEHQVIHKKDGRLHIYVRQDKYKGELKSKNWVGRLYHDGKQKISSSGTPNLEEAIPILEKWFDDVVAGKEKEKEIQEQPVSTEETSVQTETSTQIDNEQETSQATTSPEPKIDTPTLNQSSEDEQENKKSKFAF